VRGSFQETAPRKTAENTVKHRDGGVGSVVANHHGGGGISVTVTTLTLLPVFDVTLIHSFNFVYMFHFCLMYTSGVVPYCRSAADAIL